MQANSPGNGVFCLFFRTWNFLFFPTFFLLKHSNENTFSLWNNLLTTHLPSPPSAKRKLLLQRRQPLSLGEKRKPIERRSSARVRGPGTGSNNQSLQCGFATRLGPRSRAVSWPPRFPFRSSRESKIPLFLRPLHSATLLRRESLHYRLLRAESPRVKMKNGLTEGRNTLWGYESMYESEALNTPEKVAGKLFRCIGCLYAS